MKPRLEPLEERWCPAGGPPNTDTLVWKPQGGSTDASLASNWYDQTQATQGVTAPSGTNPTILDGNTANSPITTTLPLFVKSLTVQGNYNNTLTIKNGGTVTTYASNIVNSGSILTIVSADTAGILLDNTGTNFTIAFGATLNLKDVAGATSGASFFDASASNSGEYLKNAGTMNWTGTVGFGTQFVEDDIQAPVLNTGTFNVNGNNGGDNNAAAGILSVSGQDATNTNNVSFDQNSGSCNLSNGATLKVYEGYYQSGGTLQTTDATTCTLYAIGKGGDINIAGGKVVVDSAANSVGILVFIATTAEINGEIDVNGLTQGGNSTTSDLLDCRGVTTVTLQANGFLNVGTTGTGQLGTGNQWTVMKYANGALKGSWGQPPKVPTGMSASTGPQQVLVSN